MVDVGEVSLDEALSDSHCDIRVFWVMALQPVQAVDDLACQTVCNLSVDEFEGRQSIPSAQLSGGKREAIPSAVDSEYYPSAANSENLEHVRMRVRLQIRAS